MHRFFTAFYAIAFILTIGSAGVSAADKATTVAATATTCPAGQTYVKAYTKADGTKVAGYCKSSKSANGAMMASTKCPPGKTFVKGYMKKDGTKVNGYCRS